MLVALRVERFILIDALELRLEPGFNVLTGETGAGKSIVVGALGQVLGARASPEVLRPGAAQAEVEALFDLRASPELCARLEASGIGCDGELGVRRVIQQGGRSRAYLNGRLCTARELADLAPELADITSQHESVAIADARRHIEYLDRFAELLPDRAELARLVDELAAVTAQIRAVRELEHGRSEREAFLRFQLESIEALAPEPGELDELRAERGRLKHASRLSELGTRVAEALEPPEGGLCDHLGRLAAELASGAELDPGLERQARELDECWSRLRALAAEMARYGERIEADPARLEQVQDRIYRLEELLRKHGPRIEDALEARSRILGELDALEGAASRLPELERRSGELFAQASKLARQLSARRKKAGRALGEAISVELAELGMGRARVVVEVSPATGRDPEWTVGDAHLGRDGIDRVQFLIAPNEGVEPRPLGKIASGGELSRSLLALKRALGGYASSAEAGTRGVGIQVFDEVDAGVGGATADRIGRSIAGIARHRQVLCITHLAPIAAYADAHFVVHKDEAAGATTSRIVTVAGRERVAELARMLSGARVTGSTTQAAKELLASAARLRGGKSG